MLTAFEQSADWLACRTDEVHRPCLPHIRSGSSVITLPSPSSPLPPPLPPPTQQRQRRRHYISRVITVVFFVTGSGDGSVVLRRIRDLKVSGLSPDRSGGRIVLSRVNFIFPCPFHPHVIAVARKGSKPFCQKCRRQVTAKHTCILSMWLQTK